MDIKDLEEAVERSRREAAASGAKQLSSPPISQIMEAAYTTPMKGLVDYLKEMFSSADAISALAFDFDQWKAQTPENHQVKVRCLRLKAK
jgi:hypothetical protein